MTEDSEKLFYELFSQVLQTEKYSTIADAYRSSFDELQRQSQDFSPDQWQALNNYLDALTNIYHTVITIAIEGDT